MRDNARRRAKKRNAFVENVDREELLNAIISAAASAASL